MHIHYSKPISSHKYKYIFIYICLIYILFSVLNKATQNSIKIVISIKKKIFGMSLVIQWLSKTPHFYYRGRGFDLWSGNQDPTRHTTIPKKKKKKTKEKKQFAISVLSIWKHHLVAGIWGRIYVTVIFFLWNSNHLKCPSSLHKLTYHRSVLKG